MISLFMGSSCHLGVVEEAAWLMQDKSFLSIWSLRIPSMVGALWRTLTFSEDVRHNLARFVPVLKNVHHFMSFIELFLPSLLICSSWAPDKPANQLPWIPCIPIP